MWRHFLWIMLSAGCVAGVVDPGGEGDDDVTPSDSDPCMATEERCWNDDDEDVTPSDSDQCMATEERCWNNDDDDCDGLIDCLDSDCQATCDTPINEPQTPGTWVDVSPPGCTNCSAVAVNRLNGDVFVQVANNGIWKSTNQGSSWERIDGGVIGGLVILGPGFDVDQDNPSRMAVWSMDGPGGYTLDGGDTWKPIASIGRNWDFGSVDWATAEPHTMLVARHEADGEVFLSNDGAASWGSPMSFKVYASTGSWPIPPFAMVGVMDATTLVYSEGFESTGDKGIFRSTNSGDDFVKVSDWEPKTRVPVLFDGDFYLGGADGLRVSHDKGASWEQHGAALDIWVGPYFGANKQQIMVANKSGVYISTNAGETWSSVAPIPEPVNRYNPDVFGSFAWDPVHNVLYAAAVEAKLLKLVIE